MFSGLQLKLSNERRKFAACFNFHILLGKRETENGKREMGNG